MGKVKVHTSQHIDIEFDAASFGERVLATLVDLMVKAVITLVAYLIIVIIVGDIDDIPTSLNYIAILPALFYPLISEVAFGGRSVGKIVMGLRVVRTDGGQPSFTQYFIRWIMRLVELNPALLYALPGILTALITGTGQRIGDLLAGTAVIRTMRRHFLRDTILFRHPQNYTPRFPEVYMLTDRDMRTLREVLVYYQKTNNREVVTYAANHVCNMLHLQPKGVSALEFLHIIVHDYYAVS